MWLASGLLDAANVARLALLTVTLADRNNAFSGRHRDSTADAGTGFIDPTPLSSFEFAGSCPALEARADGPRQARQPCSFTNWSPLGVDNEACRPLSGGAAGGHAALFAPVEASVPRTAGVDSAPAQLTTSPVQNGAGRVTVSVTFSGQSQMFGI